jgi:hypothetical protein
METLLTEIIEVFLGTARKFSGQAGNAANSSRIPQAKAFHRKVRQGREGRTNPEVATNEHESTRISRGAFGIGFHQLYSYYRL